MAMLPSPTAAATRFTGLNRTSPHAKIPGALDSRRYGSRECDQRPAFTTSSPVRTYPRSSRAMFAGSHAVSASAHRCIRAIAYLDRRQMRIAVRGDDLRARLNLHVRFRRELLDQVAGHAL